MRFRVDGQLGDASVCHCRMCQKAFGAFYAPLVSVRDAALKWTRGTPSYFQSSAAVRRGFCAACGTPLSYEAPDGVALAIGAFDDPSVIVPGVQWGIESKLPYVDTVANLPNLATMADGNATAFLTDLVSCQHPDHDTQVWPPQ